MDTLDPDIVLYFLKMNFKYVNRKMLLELLPIDHVKNYSLYAYIISFCCVISFMIMNHVIGHCVNHNALINCELYYFHTKSCNYSIVFGFKYNFKKD